jgi:hypothetical protein
MDELKVLMEMYLETLNEKELKAYAIAKSFLGTSFQLEKSVGFLRWLRECGKPWFPAEDGVLGKTIVSLHWFPCLKLTITKYFFLNTTIIKQ